MKTSRLFLYGVAGIIGGLLIENTALIYKQKAQSKGWKLQKKLKKQLA